MQARPVIIEDDAFVGANSSITEGVLIGRGAVVSSGVNLSASTKIIDRATGNCVTGRVPPGVRGCFRRSAGGTLPKRGGRANHGCAVIVKKATGRTYQKTSVNRSSAGLMRAARTIVPANDNAPVPTALESMLGAALAFTAALGLGRFLTRTPAGHDCRSRPQPVRLPERSPPPTLTGYLLGALLSLHGAHDGRE